MALTPEQIAELRKPLAASRIKHRRQGGKQIAFIEGWDAIARANEIFGLAGWSSHAEEPVLEIVAGGNAAFYRVRVTVMVGDAAYSDVGTCGVAVPRDKTIAETSVEAFETACKGATTDAVKRALRYFGDQFALNLYDADHDERPDDEHQGHEARSATRQDGPPPGAKAPACTGCGGPTVWKSGEKNGRAWHAWACKAQCGAKFQFVKDEPPPKAPPAPRGELPKLGQAAKASAIERAPTKQEVMDMLDAQGHTHDEAVAWMLRNLPALGAQKFDQLTDDQKRRLLAAARQNDELGAA